LLSGSTVPIIQKESPGYGCTLWAELVLKSDAENNPSPKIISYLSSSACMDETIKKNKSDEEETSPESVGERAAKDLLVQIAQRGLVDVYHQSLLIEFMAMCPPNVVRARIGKILSPHGIGTLQRLQDFFGLVFKLDEHSNDQQQHNKLGIVLSCVGHGIMNVARKVT
jgi:RNA 3'-terminal phosphate cyclase